MTKQSFYNQTSDKDMLKYLRRVQRLQCETAGSIVLWIHTGTTNDYHRVKKPDTDRRNRYVTGLRPNENKQLQLLCFPKHTA